MPKLRPSKLLWLAAAFAALSAVSAPQMAAAQRGSVDISRPFTGQRPFQLEVHGGFTWYGLGMASGVRFGIPILNNGFVPSINNAVYINFGIDTYYVRWGDPNCGPGRHCYGFGLGFPVALHWEFSLQRALVGVRGDRRPVLPRPLVLQRARASTYTTAGTGSSPRSAGASTSRTGSC